MDICSSFFFSFFGFTFWWMACQLSPPHLLDHLFFSSHCEMKPLPRTKFPDAFSFISGLPILFYLTALFLQYIWYVVKQPVPSTPVSCTQVFQYFPDILMKAYFLLLLLLKAYFFMNVILLDSQPHQKFTGIGIIL